MVALIAILATRPPARRPPGEEPAARQARARHRRHEPSRPSDGARPTSCPTAAAGSCVVNFFATWCAPCQQEHPELVSFDRRHQQAGDAEVVSVVFSDDEDAVRDFFEENGGEWVVVSDPEGVVALDYGVTGIPESFVVDPNGFVVSKITGGVTSRRPRRDPRRGRRRPSRRRRSSDS